MDTQRQLKVWGSPKSHLHFLPHWGSVSPTPTSFKGQLYLGPQLRQNSTLRFLFRANREMSPATNPDRLLKTVAETQKRMSALRRGPRSPSGRSGATVLCGIPAGCPESEPGTLEQKTQRRGDFRCRKEGDAGQPPTWKRESLALFRSEAWLSGFLCRVKTEERAKVKKLFS